ncbi:hypothetical protein PoB_007180700 [Plakobranchus ocellatus]|uniref:Uncharacterized protein n=1 Tax=Plakobranchus ocellatus TaxID=259542 RepID=A0AAV4DLW9_9GAST|nr:hypothetical protein PoB_007180700 [Plakobranchus ocellatus]
MFFLSREFGWFTRGVFSTPVLIVPAKRRGGPCAGQRPTKVHSLDQPAEFNIDARGKSALAAAEVLAARVLCAMNSVKSIPERSNSVLIHLDTVSLLMAL